MKFSLSSYTLLSSLMSTIWPLLWTLYVVRASLFLLVLFLRFALFFFTWNIFLCLCIFTFCVCFYVLSRLVTSPGFEVMPLYRQCPVGPSRATLTSGQPRQTLQGCPLCGLHVSTYSDWAVIGMDSLICKATPWCGCLWAHPHLVWVHCWEGLAPSCLDEGLSFNCCKHSSV